MAFDELDDNEEAARIRMQEQATDHIFRLMDGDGNQSRINDGQPSAS